MTLAQDGTHAPSFSDHFGELTPLPFSPFFFPNFFGNFSLVREMLLLNFDDNYSIFHAGFFLFFQFFNIKMLVKFSPKICQISQIYTRENTSIIFVSILCHLVTFSVELVPSFTHVFHKLLLNKKGCNSPHPLEVLSLSLSHIWRKHTLFLNWVCSTYPTSIPVNPNFQNNSSI